VTVWNAIFLGLVQGITEFLPISSSGHLVLFEHVLGWETGKNALGFNILLHLATFMVIMVYFQQDIRDTLKAPRCRRSLALYAGLAPALVLVFAKWHKPMEALHGNLYAISCGFLVSAGFLAFAAKYCKGKDASGDFSVLDGLIVGLAQIVAITPGVSRSGMTISTALLLARSRRAAVTFSFLLGAPLMAGAAIMEINAIQGIFKEAGLVPILCGMAAAMLSGWGAIWLLVRSVVTGRLMFFACYCLAMAGVSFSWIMFAH